jgi:hypothetical protein
MKSNASATDQGDDRANPMPTASTVGAGRSAVFEDDALDQVGDVLALVGHRLEAL